MLDFLATVDPMALPLWAILLFSAAMFPVGIILPCSACCVPPCQLCTEGELPDTVTVTFDGFTDQTQGPNLIGLSISACFGGGATAVVTAPGGDPDTDAGPISAVSMTNAGSGYAKLGRVAPTITAAGGSGEGAAMTVTLSQEADNCGVDYWAVDSISVTGGTGYLDGDAVSLSIASGDTESQAASATIHTTRTEPTLTPSVAGGSGAEFDITLSSGGDPVSWSVESVDVTDGGTGYADTTAFAVTLGADDYGSGLWAEAYSGRSEPTISLSVASATGSGSSLTATLTEGTNYDGRAIWSISSVAIDNAGTGYADYDEVIVTVTDGTGESYYNAYVLVDGNGAITSVDGYDGGWYWKSTGAIESVHVFTGGSYYHDDGVPTGVTVETPGVYYREDASAMPYVANVTVSVSSQTLPSNGSGATLTATVDDDPESPTFGRLTEVTVSDGGDGYLAWKWIADGCCGHQLNGKAFVLQRTSACEYTHFICGGWNKDALPQGIYTGVTNTLAVSDGDMFFTSQLRLAVEYRGPSLPPRVHVGASGSSNSSNRFTCYGSLTGDAAVEDCGDFSFSASNVSGVTAAIEAGGTYDPTAGIGGPCAFCCQGAEPIPEEVSVSVQQTVEGGFPDYSGDYVLSLNTQPYWEFEIVEYPWSFGVYISIDRGPCASSCDNCIKKCRIWPSIQIYDSAFGGAYAYSIHSLANGWDSDCNRCEDTPICSPPTGAYSLVDYSSGDPAFEVTVS